MKLDRIFIDIDGVLAKFIEAALWIHEVPFFFEERTDLHGTTGWDIDIHLFPEAPGKFWAPTNNAQFWAGLGLYDWAYQLVAMCERVCEGDVYFLTSPSLSEHCIPGKMRWVRTHFPAMIRKTVYTPHKFLLAGRGRLLFDDYDGNVDSWRDAGGRAFLVPQYWNSKFAQVGEGWMADVQGVLGADWDG